MNAPDYTLVVVDMQPNFEAANSEYTIEKVEGLIKQAVIDGMPVIFLEYGMIGGEQCLRTHQRLYDYVISRSYEYEKFHVGIKQFDDGSHHVKKFVDMGNYPKNFHVCGVNIAYCVHSTVHGLAKKYGPSNVIVHAAACNQRDRDDRCIMHNRDRVFQKMQEKGINVIEAKATAHAEA